VLTIFQIDESIVLDPKNYVRKGPGDSHLGELRPVADEICSCSLCLSDECKKWVFAIETDTEHDESRFDFLLAPRALGYALTRKQWCQFAFEHIEIVDASKDDAASGQILEELVFPESVDEDEQEDILCLVKRHSEVMSLPVEKRLGDTVSGKGESLILLFHGMCPCCSIS
jgi:hypothetical protein